MEARPVAAEGALRPSFVVIAVGIGLGVGFAAYDRTGQLGQAFTVGMKAFGYALAVLFSLPVLNWIASGAAHAWAEADAAREAAKAGAGEQPPAPPSHVSLAGDLSDLERYVQDGLRMTLENARAAGGLTWDCIGHAYANTRTWVWWTDIAAVSGLAVKRNGEPTVLPPGKTYAWALRQVRLGFFELPDPVPPALPQLPALVRAGELEKVKPVAA